MIIIIYLKKIDLKMCINALVDINFRPTPVFLRCIV